MSSLQAKLSQDIAEISWQDLLPHAKRDALIVVKSELDLSTVAAAIAEDLTSSVQTWIADGAIAKPTVEQLSVWNDDQQKQFTTLIVQPFVVIQELKPLTISDKLNKK